MSNFESKDLVFSIRTFIDFIEKTAIPNEKEDFNNQYFIAKVFDEFAFWSHIIKDRFYLTDELIFDKKNYPDILEFDPIQSRERIRTIFPHFGEYFTIQKNETVNEKPKIEISNAIDDINCVYCDLKTVLYRIEKNSIEDGLWHFEILFAAHYGKIIRNFQKYLHEKLHDINLIRQKANPSTQG